MKLDRVFVQNYKSIPPTGLELWFRDRIAILVGRNNAGKSNILSAISLVASQKNPRFQRYPREWFHDPSLPLVVGVEFSGVDFGEGRRIGLSERQCRLLEAKDRKGPKPAAGRITLRLEAYPPPEETSEEETEDAQERAEDGQPLEAPKTDFVIYAGENHEIRRTEEIRSRIFKCIAVPALRGHSDLLAPSIWTSYGRLLRDILADSDRLDELRKLVVGATAHLQETLSTEANVITKAASATAFVDRVEFRLTKDDDPLELLRNVSLGVSFGDRIDDLSSVGTGTQSAVVLGILELCLRHRSTSGARIFLVEEPELYLHPHAQRAMARMLRKVAESGSYVVMTTHSTDIILGMDIRSVARVDRTGLGSATAIRQLPANTDLVDAARVLSRQTAEMLFADRVVLVEGPSEEALLPTASSVVGSCDFDQRNMSVVNVGGKKSFSRFTRFLDALGIEWRIVADHDALEGNDLRAFWARASITEAHPPEERLRKLRKVGVCVLRFGEIEDYYPNAALAFLAGCALENVPALVDANRAQPDDPSVVDAVCELVTSRRDDLIAEPVETLRSTVSDWYSRTVTQLRAERDPRLRKTGAALSRWLGLPKPVIAAKVAEWIRANPTNVPNRLYWLLMWLVAPQHAETPTASPPPSRSSSPA